MPSHTAPFDHARALSHCLRQQSSNIARHQLANGETVWVRRAGPRHPAWRYRLLGGVAGILRLGVLTPIPNLGGTAGIATEARRLQALAQAGVTVPPLLAQQADALMMGSVGQHDLLHEWSCQQQAPDVLLQRWQLGLDAIADVHRKQQYLSQAFARNLMYDSQTRRIAFIDFEDDPGSVMPLPLCQARDWLCYLHSGARIMHNAGITAAARRAWSQTLAAETAEVAATVTHALQRLRPLRRLQAGFWGSDTLRLAAMAAYGRQP